MRKRDGIRKEKVFRDFFAGMVEQFLEATEVSVVRNADSSVDAQLMIPCDRDTYQTIWIELSHVRFPTGLSVWVSFGTYYKSLPRARKRSGQTPAERDRSKYLYFSGVRYYYHRGESSQSYARAVANLWYQLVQLDNDTDFDIVGIGVRLTFDRHQPDVDKYPPENAPRSGRRKRTKLRKPPKPKARPKAKLKAKPKARLKAKPKARPKAKPKARPKAKPSRRRA